MNCFELQDRLLEAGPIPAPERAAVDDHLETCSACRSFAARVGDLDRRLARQLQAPKLPADFDARLWARIAAEPPARASTEGPGAKDAGEWNRFSRRARWTERLLDGAAGGTLVLLLGAVLVRHLPALAGILPAANLSLGAQTALASTVALVTLAAGFVVAFPRQANELLQNAF